MISKRAAIFLLALAMIGLIAYFYAEKRGIGGSTGILLPRKEHLENISSCIGGGREIAEERAKALLSKDIYLKDIKYEIYVERKYIPLFKYHIIYLVNAEEKVPYMKCLPLRDFFIAVGCDNETFLLPDEFNYIIKRENITVNSNEKALEVLKTYINFSLYGARILNSTSEIPGINCGRHAEVELNRIRPPEVKHEEEGYLIHFFLWRKVGGIVLEKDCRRPAGIAEELTVRMEKDGEISVLARKLVINEGIAVEKIRKMRKPYLCFNNITVMKRYTPTLLKNYTLYSAYGVLGMQLLPIGAVAVSNDGKAFLLPDINLNNTSPLNLTSLLNEFNYIIKRENITVNSNEKALEVLKTYINSSSLSRMRILYNISDIRGFGLCIGIWDEKMCNFSLDYCRRLEESCSSSDKGCQNKGERCRETYKKLRDLIRPPEIRADENGYIIHFFTWAELGGSVDEWTVKVGRDGTISVLEKESVGEVDGYFLV